MIKKTFLLLFALCLSVVTMAQESKLWTEADRKYLLDNLVRSRDELIKETKGLTEAQWNFKEAPDRWSINQVVEHLAIYELLFCRDIGRSLGSKATPEFNVNSKPDSYFVTFIMEEEQHITTDFTKPFTYSVPMGNNDGQDNIAWFLKMRNESVDLVKTANQDLRAHYRNAGSDNVHQVYIYVFGHVDRHLRQIRKVKASGKYPK